MKIAISNIAWEPAENEAVWALLQQRGIYGLEVAPALVSTEFTSVDATVYTHTIAHYGLQVVAAQALLFGRPDLVLFGSPEARVALGQHLRRMIDFLHWLGGSTAVFGSPKNRLTNGLSSENVQAIATDFFGSLGEYAAKKGIVLALEPNPRGYGADFVTTTAEAVALAKTINNPGFTAHLDVGSLIMNNEDPGLASVLAMPWINHVHVSEPNLAPVGLDHESTHRIVAEQLREHNYQGWVSVEMKKNETGSNIPAIMRALDFVQSIYG